MMLNRRQTLALAAATLATPALARAEGPIVINALGGLSNPNLQIGRKPGAATDMLNLEVDARGLADAKASGLTAVNVTLGYVAGDFEPYPYTLQTIDAWDRLLADNPDKLLLVRRAADIRRAKAEGKIGVIYGFQNAVQIGEHLERVDEFAGRGVRVVQLTYNPANPLGDGSMAPENRGLTETGRRVIEKLNQARVMVDLSHSGERTCLDAIAASKAPISINHTGCRAITDLPRNKTDAELREVAEKGGFVGIYFMPFLDLDGHASAAQVADHIEYALKICGEDHVGIGTDGSVATIDDMDAYAAALAQEHADRKAAGIAAKGERADTYPFVLDLRGPDQFRKLASLLAARGHPPRVVEKVLGLNFLRYAEAIWG
jgi:membrane dipeptidase